MSVPITKGNYADNETLAYSYLTSSMGLNTAAACGVLANISKESGFNPNASGDKGTSYGICQWRGSRRTNLVNYCNRNNLNHMSVKGQLAYLQYELKNSYPAVWDILTSVSNDADGAWEAAAHFCARFEIPAGYGAWNDGVLTLGSTSISRGNSGRDVYWSAYSKTSVSTKPIPNKGNTIVEEAKRHLGKPYVWGAEGPNGFDCSGFVYYVYKVAVDYNWSRTTAYYQWKNYGKVVSKSELKAGDLVFFTGTYSTGNNPNISHVGIATGNGDEFIQASGSNVNISRLSNSYWSKHYYAAKRLLHDSETSGTSAGVNYDVSTSPSYMDIELAGSINLSRVDNYLDIINSAVEELDELQDTTNSGWKYGYLLDLTNGGEFKFYVPEFGESNQANWDDISIIGRSASIKAYNSTQSRSIDISLTLVAGTGLYSTGEDRIDDMMRDVEFVRSLEYPDYSKAIVLPPATVLLYLNPLVKLRGVVTQVRTNYKKPYDNKNRPMICELSFTVVQTTSSPPDYSDIRGRTAYSY